jgi:CRISPR-associated protein Csd1
MYLKTPIKWIIDLNAEGKFQGIVKTTGKREKNDRGKEFMAPHIGRSVGIKAKLLADNAEYVLGIAREDSKPGRVKESHEAFIETLRQCAEATRQESVCACLKFLETMEIDNLLLPDDFDPSHNITFRVNGILAIELPEIQEYWAKTTTEPETEGMECLICSKIRPPMKRLPIKIKGIPGGQPSGMSIISANASAFESFGLEASLIAPTCQECGEKFSKVANYLIHDEKTHINIGPLVYLFWTKEETGFSPLTFFDKPEPGEVKALIEGTWKGRQYTAIDETAFYSTAFSASGGRVAVRDWIETTVSAVKRNLARWFVLQRIVEPNGEEGRPYGLYPLAASLYQSAKDIAPNLPKTLLQTALKGSPLSKWLLSMAINRNRAEQGVTRPRAVLIKMVLLSDKNLKEGGEDMERLNLKEMDPGYLCGRLLAVLEEAQRAAINPSATIVDRFFGTASSAPASVFSRLIRGSQAHLSKLRRDRPGTCNAIQQRLEEILAGLDGFPQVLTLDQQGLFALGYYHQRANDRAKAIAYKEAKSKKEEEKNGELH